MKECRPATELGVRDQAIVEACKLVSLAWHHLDGKIPDNYVTASDGFCKFCSERLPSITDDKYRNESYGFAYVRRAIIEQFKRDGIELGLKGWNEDGSETDAESRTVFTDDVGKAQKELEQLFSVPSMREEKESGVTTGENTL